MTMHLEKPYLTTTRYNRKTKQTAAQRAAKGNHDAWLRKMGVHPEQLKLANSVKNTIPNYRVNNNVPLSNEIAGTAPKRDIWEKIRTGNESEETVAAIKDKATRCLPAYNKGGIQYLGTDKETLKHAGKKNSQ